MPAIHRLSATSLPKLPVGKHCDGAGLWFHQRPDGGAQWVLRLTLFERRREMGLGRFPDVTLRHARDMAVKYRSMAREGVDPIKARRKERRDAARDVHTLADVTRLAFEARQAQLKGGGVNGRWMSPLDNHVLPKLGKTPVSEIDQNDIRNVLAPIWHTKADVARKALQRLSIVMKYAAAMELPVDIQATDKAKALLGKTTHVSKNIPAMDWRDVPTFYQSLNGGTLTELALRLLILTGARSMPIRHAHVDQFEGDVWNIRAELMKAGGDFRVPLSAEAQSVIAATEPFRRPDGYLFPSTKRGSVISDATMSGLMKRTRKMIERPHGFRSSLRTWIAETTTATHEVAETMMAHSVGSQVEQAYRRTDFLDQRRELLEQWADHVTGAATSL